MARRRQKLSILRKRLVVSFIHDFWFQVEKELASLAMSQVPESNEKKGALVMKIKHSLISKLRVLLFNNTSDTQGGEQVRDLFKTFHDSVFKVSRRVASWSLAARGSMGRVSPIQLTVCILIQESRRFRIPSHGFQGIGS